MDPIDMVNLERLTNGMYAFTMTLMVRNIQSPVPGTITSDVTLLKYLVSIIPSISDFIGAFGFISGIFFLLMEDENRTVRFHALQSTLLFFGLVVVIVIFSVIPFLSLLIPVVWLIEMILWLLLIITAYRGMLIRLPLFGTIAASYV